jgi:hypothetical protein
MTAAPRRVFDRLGAHCRSRSPAVRDHNRQCGTSCCHDLATRHITEPIRVPQASVGAGIADRTSEIIQNLAVFVADRSPRRFCARAHRDTARET